jgi:hypothetical protein
MRPLAPLASIALCLALAPSVARAGGFGGEDASKQPASSAPRSEGALWSGDPWKEAKGPAYRGLDGLGYTIAPGFLVNGQSGTGSSVAFALDDHFGYAFGLGHVALLDAGLSVPFWFFDNRFTFATLLDVRLYFPVSVIAPYVRLSGGASYGFPSGADAQVDGIFRGGGGLLVFPVSMFGIGAEVTYVRMQNAPREANLVEVVFPITVRF